MMPGITFKQIRRPAVHLVEAGFADVRQFPVWRETDVVDSTFENAGCVQCRTRNVREVVAKVASCYSSEREPVAETGSVWRSPTLLARKKAVAGRTTWVGPNLDPWPVNANCS